MKDSKLIELVGRYGIYYHDKKGNTKTLQDVDLVYSYDQGGFVWVDWTIVECGEDFCRFEKIFGTIDFNKTWTINHPRFIKRFEKVKANGKA